MAGCIQSIRSTHNNAKDLYETQINKLKDTIENQQRELEAAQAEHKLQSGRLQQTVTNLETEIQHLKKLQVLELQKLRNELKT